MTATHINPLRIGLDVGSTTVKIVILDSLARQIHVAEYQRHYAEVFETLTNLMRRHLANLRNRNFTVTVTGSAGIGIAENLRLPFVQEVIACTEAVTVFIPQTNTVIELGGEDAKITFFDGSIDLRMNETCAGGTGAFIDQIAATLKTDAAGINELASRHHKIYPIAARCGVFTKSDVTMLLNEGAAKEDVAASVLQAIVEQTIGGLACGRKIQGNVAFLGGPLHFLPELRRLFIETLKLTQEQAIVHDNAHFFVALGAALLSAENKEILSATEILQLFENTPQRAEHCVSILVPLFATRAEYEQFQTRHDQLKAEYAELSRTSGDVFLGIDAGSTTTKAVLLDEDNRILCSWYGSNEGNPIQTVLNILQEIDSNLPATARLKNSCVTGYGEYLLQAAFGIDMSEVETLAHYRAARFFVPDVSFILDIGGQDIKCLSIKGGQLDKIILNEACSSGCGSFVETFAQSLGNTAADFAQAGLFAEHPIDLGTRCTVFMNSKVKQALKENATVADISAGISYSVAKNALYKVLKISDASELGTKVVVQGGTFNNPAVLRAFEHLIRREVYRTDISGMMGAFGAALIAAEKSQKGMLPRNKPHQNKPYQNKSHDVSNSTVLSGKGLENFSVTTTQTRCNRCSNKCPLSIHRFSSTSDDTKPKTFISGNRCDRGVGKETVTRTINLFREQYERIFAYEPLEPPYALFGDIGLPKVLNMFENFPFWVTLFQELGFRVVLSNLSSKQDYDKGLSGITSQTLCYPAKMVHGHILNLIDKGVKRIFYPALPVERREFKESSYSYSCPVVGSYPEVIRLNVDEIKEHGIDFIQPFLPGNDPIKLAKLFYADLKKYGVNYRKLIQAAQKAFSAQIRYEQDIRQRGEEVVHELLSTGQPAVVLGGHPYHLDPMIHHGIPELINSLGIAVLSGDSVAHLGKELLFPLNVVDQWRYHARLYRVATFTAKHKQFQMVQLTSFGCGLDAVVAEQVAEILHSVGKPHTLLKIDEGTQLGAVKIRIRSLLSTMQQTQSLSCP
ncbi:MAG: acyl-CoA dehydratase activase [Planctomycetaceae bacterium]|jgi:predicted CoA-substrate-specific enzyme activase|nr:acyl-CoA dehydratase activase [Planctomycetaceae bacterium]